MKHLIASVRILAFLTIVTGVAYPLLVTIVGQNLFHARAEGSLREHSGILVGSDLIAQNFESDRYFWPRPSAVGYNPLPSGGSNQGQTSADLKNAYDERLKKLKAAHPTESGEPPQDLLFASGSGLDPHIGPRAAEYQVRRVAQARDMEVQVVRDLVVKATEGRQFGILGQPRVNVLMLNLALDRTQGITSALTPRPGVEPK